MPPFSFTERLMENDKLIYIDTTVMRDLLHNQLHSQHGQPFKQGQRVDGEVAQLLNHIVTILPHIDKMQQELTITRDIADEIVPNLKETPPPAFTPPADPLVVQEAGPDVLRKLGWKVEETETEDGNKKTTFTPPDDDAERT